MLLRCVVLAATSCVLIGCHSNYRELRTQGQQMMIDGAYGPARALLMQADEVKRRRVENLYDIGLCGVMLARDLFQQRNAPAAYRELDQALAYFERALDEHPGHQPSLEGRNVAQELKGQFDVALAGAEWAAEFVGPSANQQVFLAQELEERGDLDGAFLRYRQAVAMEPRNDAAHVAFAQFLLRRGKDTEGVYHLQTAYRLNPFNRIAANELIARDAIPTDAPVSPETPPSEIP
ncbi:MAG: hypothetical protein IIB61_09420 [Planctomycetes bacterium]|nr:hypothetical protein [Planctomycetota bacterium]